MVMRAFKKFDQDGDGNISPAEISEVLKVPPPPPSAHPHLHSFCPIHNLVSHIAPGLTRRHTACAQSHPPVHMCRASRLAFQCRPDQASLF